MSTILSRIQELAATEGITIGALERVIGASKGVLSRAISNGTDIQSKWIQRLVENYPRYSASWLLSGKGDKFSDKNKDLPTINQKFIGAPYYNVDFIGATKPPIQTTTSIILLIIKKEWYGATLPGTPWSRS